MGCSIGVNMFKRYNLGRQIYMLDTYEELLKLYGWKKGPIYVRPDLHTVRGMEDLNNRRIRDTEAISTIARNIDPGNIIEIGTGTGAGTVLLSKSAPRSQIYTVNILPEDEQRSGRFNTEMMSKEKIGSVYKKLKLSNIHQIYANSLFWEPKLDKVNMAFIDGAHDAGNVYQDTKKMLNLIKGGGFILWHDFNPELRNFFPWIDQVMKGVERCYAEGILTEKIMNIKNSWVGIYPVRKT